MSWFWIAIASVLSGTLGAMGLGGGGILLLVLVWAGWPQMTAQGINLLMILPVGLLGLYFHRKNGLTDGKAAWPLLLGGLPGVLLGVLLGTRLGENTLRACFGVLILLLAARELWLGVQAIRRDGWRVLFRFLFRAVQRVQAQFPRQLEQGVRHDLLRRQVCLPPYLFIKVIQKIFHPDRNHFHSIPSLFPVYTIFSLRSSGLKEKASSCYHGG